MPGPLLHVGATVLCAHGGQATPVKPEPSVLINGQPVVTASSPYAIAGCSLPAPTAGNGPCATAQFTSAATRVTVLGQPVLLQDSQATCAPTGTPVTAPQVQKRVVGI